MLNPIKSKINLPAACDVERENERLIEFVGKLPWQTTFRGLGVTAWVENIDENIVLYTGIERRKRWFIRMILFLGVMMTAAFFIFPFKGDTAGPKQFDTPFFSGSVDSSVFDLSPVFAAAIIVVVMTSAHVSSRVIHRKILKDVYGVA